MANINWSDPQATQTLNKFKTNNPNFNDEQARIALSEGVDKGAVSIDKFTTPQQKQAVEYKAATEGPFAGREVQSSFDVPGANTVGAGNVATPATTTPSSDYGAPIASTAQALSKGGNGVIGSAIKQLGKNIIEKIPGIVKNIPGAVKTAGTFIGDMTTKGMGPAIDIAKGGKYVAPTLEGLKAAAKAAPGTALAKGLIGNPYITGILAAGETAYDSTTGKLKQTGNYWKDAALSLANYTDSVLMNVPELLTKATGNTPFWERTPEERQKFQEDQKGLAENKKTQQENKGFVENTNEALTGDKGSNKADPAVVEQWKVIRKQNPALTTDQLFKTYKFDPKQGKIVVR